MAARAIFALLLRSYGDKRTRNKRIGPGGGTRRLHQIPHFRGIPRGRNRIDGRVKVHPFARWGFRRYRIKTHNCQRQSCSGRHRRLIGAGRQETNSRALARPGGVVGAPSNRSPRLNSSHHHSGHRNRHRVVAAALRHSLSGCRRQRPARRRQRSGMSPRGMACSSTSSGSTRLRPAPRRRLPPRVPSPCRSPL